MFLLKLFFLAFVTVLSANQREKRLVLHSDLDITAEIIHLRTQLENLSQEVVDLKEANNKLNSKLQLVDTARYTIDKGSVYVRWGRTICDGNGTQLIYKGYMGGSGNTQSGNGANHLCLPEDPTWGKFEAGNQAGTRSYIYGTEYQVDHDVVFGKHVRDEDIPCAVCNAPGVSMMIPARANCYSGWRLEYTRYLMAAYHDHASPADYVCVDGNPEFTYGGETNTYAHTLYLVEGICGTIPCPPYHNYQELACSVCSK